MEGIDVTDLVRAGSDCLCAPPQHRYVLMDIACLCGLGIDCLFVGIVCLCGSVASRSVAGMLWLSKTLWPHGTCCRTQPGGRFTTGSAPKRGGSSRAHGPDPPGGLRPACGLRRFYRARLPSTHGMTSLGLRAAPSLLGLLGLGPCSPFPHGPPGRGAARLAAESSGSSTLGLPDVLATFYHWTSPRRRVAPLSASAMLGSSSVRVRGDHLQARGDHLQTRWALPTSDGPCQHLIDLASIR